MKEKTLDLHHLFPKNYLKNSGIDEQKDYNQVANYMYLEYKDNINISDKNPKEYWNELVNSLSDVDRANILKSYQDTYDLPEGFWNLQYFDFIEKRRQLMAKGIKEYFNNL
ncbi:hypothetical protein HYG87_10830 [Methanobacterium alkalithermotolerans]|uniref:DUF1524 domain-containing protein n=1 Tax=Methanobacterium alkalithermotolerans TaxID=2731220 RepID=A0A8T8K6H1_9EURY|nr:hypothetical protein [Methanobacterium alkalithermotolerans]QUH24216.1 hypothetical protein HYG87_10830 [Methanobacterium alkalithermotolerans]